MNEVDPHNPRSPGNSPSESLVADEAMALGETLPVAHVPGADETFHEKADNRWLEMWRSMVANKAAMISMLFIIFLLFLALFGPWITPYNPIETDMSNTLKPPSPAHWFGTDQLGMDIFSRVIAGARVSLTVGLLAVSIALL